MRIGKLMSTTRRRRVRRAFVALVLLLGSRAIAARAMPMMSTREESSLAVVGRLIDGDREPIWKD